MQFEIIKQYKNARLGKLKCRYGEIDTPAFIFCATKGVIKCMLSHQLDDTQVILSNTYHLMVSPGGEYLQQMGGLHKFMSWNKPLFTDSGGFQIFSLGYGKVADDIKGRRLMSNNVTVTRDKAIFKSYLSGKKEILTPEESIKIQSQIGSNFMMPLDICTTSALSRDQTESSMIHSHEWEERSLKYFFQHDLQKKHALYGIVQGGIHEQLRDQSISFCEERDFFGTAIGGSLGKTRNEMYRTVEYTMSRMKQRTRPVHLLGIGGLNDIYHGVLNGIDTFDCVHPTRISRHGTALIKKGRVNILNSKYKYSDQPLSNECTCATCKNYSQSYLHYLFKRKEISGMNALTIHNIHFMNSFMKEIRNGIKNDNLEIIMPNWLPSSLEQTTIM